MELKSACDGFVDGPVIVVGIDGACLALGVPELVM